MMREAGWIKHDEVNEPGMQPSHQLGQPNNCSYPQSHARLVASDGAA